MMYLYLVLFVLGWGLLCGQSPIVHRAHLSSGWYTQEKVGLQNNLQRYFPFVQKHFSVPANHEKVRALIVPHAGHYYSGICAASAYQAIRGRSVKRVVILAPSHGYGFTGVALPDYDTYRTVLGDVPVDKDFINSLLKKPLFSIIAKAHSPEHSIEIQLPFLQFCMKGFAIVPLVIGALRVPDYDAIATALEGLIDNETVVIVSTDFVHYGPRYGFTPFSDNLFYNIRRLDSQAIHAISRLSFEEFDTFVNRTNATICGRNAIRILLKLIEKGALGKVSSRLTSYYTSPQVLAARSRGSHDLDVHALMSGVTDASAQNSVSYAGLVFTQESLVSVPLANSLTGYEKLALLKLVGDVIVNEVKKLGMKREFLYPVISSGLRQVAGVFVTLHKKVDKKAPALRGCIGRIIATQPLYRTVADMAIASAFHDYRFSPVRVDELEMLVPDINVLSPPRPVSSYKDIVLGKHGIILKKRGRQAVFLPKVPLGFGWDLPTTLEHLSVKAGLSKDDWRTGCSFEVFEGVEIGGESGIRTHDPGFPE